MPNWQALNDKLLAAFPAEEFDSTRRGVKCVKLTGPFIRETGAQENPFAWVEPLKAALPEDVAAAFSINGIVLHQVTAPYHIEDVYLLKLVSSAWSPLTSGQIIPEIVPAFSRDADGVVTCRI